MAAARTLWASRIVVGALVIAACVVLSVLAYHYVGRPAPGPEYPPNETHTVAGSDQTCADVVARPCDYALQRAYNEWGGNLDAFVGSVQLDRGLPPMSHAELAREGLLTCRLLDSFDNNDGAFLDMMSAEHPGQEPTLYYPIWFQSRDVLCTAVVAGQR